MEGLSEGERVATGRAIPPAPSPSPAPGNGPAGVVVLPPSDLWVTMLLLLEAPPGLFWEDSLSECPADDVVPAGCNGPPTPAEADRGVPHWDFGVPVGGELLEFIFPDRLESFPDEWP